MARRGNRQDEPGLFDLPLDPPPGPTDRQAAEPGAPPEAPAEPVSERLLPVEEVRLGSGRGRALRRARPSTRWLAGLADLAVHVAMALALLFGARLLDVHAGLGDWPALIVFLLVFSFLYHVLPLAFWGQTPGMAWAGLVARTAEGENLTFGQTARRWLGALATLLLAGLPALLSLAGGRSFTDRVSGSETYEA
jgi:uncharacterized RDD family membrane protein YckC